MHLYRGLPAAADAPVALTIGNFDGVHRGHQAMLARLGEAAEDLRLPAAVMTFDPHPREFFAPDSAPPRLSTTRDKLELFRAYGVARAYVARFDARLAGLSAEAFIDDVLVAPARRALGAGRRRLPLRQGPRRRPRDAASACEDVQRRGDGDR